MTYPLWLANSGILFISLLTAAGLWLTKPTVQAFKNLAVSSTPTVLQQERPAINIKEIYERDFFGTYIKPEPPRHSHAPLISAPPPPKPRPIKIPTPSEPNFIDPLEITLKGIIYVSGKEEKSRAIIQDNTTQQEQLYKTGEPVIDGQLIRIFENKVLVLRSNGQQETLYLREQDSRLDPSFALLTGWEDVIQQTQETTFIIDPIEFIHRVPSLAQFIDQLDLTTVFRKGTPLGTRIGSVGPNSLATALGLMQGDIVLSINDIPATDTQERIKIYKSVIHAPEEAVFSVQFLRNNQLITHQYSAVIIDDTHREKEDSPKSDDAITETQTETAYLMEQLRQKERSKVRAYYTAPDIVS